ncbi:MAG: hypothetical protein CFE45_43945, partial [Burkholderiales bacterium PBB5]
FADFVGALIGIGTPSLRGRDAVADHAKLHFAGLLSRQVRSAEGLGALLSGWLRRPVQVQQFVGAWLPLRSTERTRLGRRLGGRTNLGAKLGQGAVLGAMVWDRQHHFALLVGPLDHAAFTALLPGGSALPGLVALVEQYVGHEFGWHLQLGLRSDEIRPARPGQHGRLGWDSWLGRRPRPSYDEFGFVIPSPPADTTTAPLRLAPVEALQALARRRRRAAPSHPHP